LVVDKSALRARFARLDQCLAKVRSILDGVGEEAYFANPFVLFAQSVAAWAEQLENQ
jgi:hypothetical protein